MTCLVLLFDSIPPTTDPAALSMSPAVEAAARGTMLGVWVIAGLALALVLLSAVALWRRS